MARTGLAMVRVALAIAIKEHYAKRGADLLTTFNEQEIRYCNLLASQVEDINMEHVYRQAFDALFKNLPVNVAHEPGHRSRFATLGKYCKCGHGIGAHRSSAGAEENHCRQCACVQYEHDNENPNDWSKRGQ